MKRSIFSIAIAAVMAIFSVTDSDANVKEGLFGIGANFSTDNQMASLYYAADPQFDLALMFGFNQYNQDGEDAINAFTTGFQFNLMKIFSIGIYPYLE